MFLMELQVSIPIQYYFTSERNLLLTKIIKRLIENNVPNEHLQILLNLELDLIPFLHNCQ